MIFRKKASKSRSSVLGKNRLADGTKSQQTASSRDNSNERRRPEGVGSPVFSYYARGNKTASQTDVVRDEIKGKRLGSKRRRWPRYIMFTAILAAVLYSCYLLPNPKIILLSSSGTIHREPQIYQDAVNDSWSQSILNRTKLTVPAGDIRAEIKKQFPELSDIKIELPLLGRRPIVTLIPGQPSLQLISKNGPFYVNKYGIVMARTTGIIANELPDIPIVQDETGISAEPGKAILSGPEAKYLTRLSEQLQAENIKIQSITLPAGAAKEADVRISGISYYIKFSFDLNPRQAVGSYLAAKAKLDAEKITPAEYIDVRVEEKLFYK